MCSLVYPQYIVVLYCLISFPLRGHDNESILGEWVIDSVYWAGKKFGAFNTGISYDIRKETINITLIRSTSTVRYKTLVGKSVKYIDFYDVNGEALAKGIVKVEKAKLFICFGSNKERPNSFDQDKLQGGTPTMLLIFKKE